MPTSKQDARHEPSDPGTFENSGLDKGSKNGRRRPGI